MELITMYEEVFKDCVICYLENLEEKDREKITDYDIKNIANKLIYSNEYIWEVINDVISVYVDKILSERGEK